MIKQEHNLTEVKDQKPEALTEPEIKVSEYKAPVNPADDEFRAMWRAEGGEFPWHPYSWAGRMQEDKLLTLMRELVALRAASASQTTIAQSEKASTKTNEQPMRDLADLLKQRVSDGQPLIVTGKLDEAVAKAHAATVNDILESTGKPVTVVHLPN